MGDWTNLAGTAIQTVVVLASIGTFIFRLHVDLRLLLQKQAQFVERVTKIENKVDALSSVLIDIAKQDARLNNLESRIQELSNRIYDHIKKEVA